VVATDSPHIAEVCRAFGARVVRSDVPYVSGTDRTAAVAAQLGLECVVNLQGDEPLMPPAVIDEVIAAVEAGHPVATAAGPLGEGSAADPNHVTVLTGRENRALYFTRAPVPHLPTAAQFEELRSSGRAAAHLGVYGFTRDALRRFAGSPPGVLERIERLEQLRFIELGIPITVVHTAESPVGINVPADLVAAEAVCREESRGACSHHPDLPRPASSSETTGPRS
jgi:3-deoxy-manno-octulosonate cytidylyltransferase (CMP-KDO synthetase)